MDITWYGLSCFRLRERGVVALCDPFSKEATGLALPKVRADIVTISHDAPGHNHSKGVSGDPKVLRSPGDYEVKYVMVAGLSTSLNGREGNPAAAASGIQRNVAFFLDFDGFTVGHLGDLSRPPAQGQMEDLGDIDVLLVPVAGANTLEVSRIAEVISLLDPRIVVPMHYRHEGLHNDLADSLEPVDRFLKELGINDPEVVDTLRVTKSNVPEETQVVLLPPTAVASS